MPIAVTKNPVPEDKAIFFHPTKNEFVKVENLSAGSGKIVWWICNLGHEWKARVNDFCTGHGCPYCSGNKVWVGFNDLKTINPELAEEWHPTKNGDLHPNMFTSGSKTKVWWLGKCNHEWLTGINIRSVNKNGCPYCAGQKILVGFNDLLTTEPKIAEQWDYNKNTVIITDVTSGSAKKFWWLCDKGHSYNAYMGERKKGSGCYYCNNNKILTGFNDLLFLHPDICEYWDYNKNKIHPNMVSPLSSTKMWWLCENNHSYSLPVRTRVTYVGKNPCNFCNGSRILKGFNDLTTSHPEIAAEWDEEKNIVPLSTVSKGSTGIFWWKCKNHPHSFQSRVNGLTRGYNCNICSNNKVLTGFNDINTTNPEVVPQFHPTKNGNLTVFNMTMGSGKKVWWKCDRGHEWLTSPVSRFSKKTGYLNGCKACFALTFSSVAEQEIVKILENEGLTIIPNDRKVLNGLELDIYVPEKNFAIEYNGLYWHSEKQKKDKKYHYNKWLACKNKGIQLIQIWEDDWEKNKTIIINGMKHKLGLSDQSKIYARKTFVTELNLKETQTFMKANHIQGFASGSYYLGLKTKETETLVAVIITKKEKKDTLNIIRYATNHNVIGGFTKLLSHMEKTYNPNKFITFSDHCISDGGLYENNGFIADKELPPDYMYVVGKVRKHKFGYRLVKFKNDPNLQHVEGYTERELAELNGLNRIWDAGKTRWVKTIGDNIHSA